jgi:hypothetical protein
VARGSRRRADRTAGSGPSPGRASRPTPDPGKRAARRAVHQLDGRAIKARAVTQIAISGDPHRAAQREIKPRRWQWPQPGAVLDQPIGDDELPRSVAATMCDPVTPVAIDPVKLRQGLEATRGPEPGLQIPHSALDRSLLPRGLRRARRGVKRVVTAEVQEPRIPADHLAAVALGDRGPEVVIDALARDATEPVKHPDMPLQERLDGHVKAEVRGLRAAERQRRHQRIDPTLNPADPRTGRHLTPIKLHHLTRAISRPLRRTLLPRTQRRQLATDQINRPLIVMLVAQHLGQSGRLDLRPLPQHPVDHRHQPIQLRPRRRSHIPRRRIGRQRPRDRPPMNTQPLGDLPLRHAVPIQRPDLRPLQRAHHLSRPPSRRSTRRA